MKKKRGSGVTDDKLVAWGRANVRRLNDSRVFCGILNGGELDRERLEFTLHIGHALLTGKPIILAIPFDAPTLPAKLTAVADKIVRYDPGNLESLRAGVARVLTELDVATQ